MEHGAGGKWYLNAEKYSTSIVEKYNRRDFLIEQYKNFEQMSVRKFFGTNVVGLVPFPISTIYVPARH